MSFQKLTPPWKTFWPCQSIAKGAHWMRLQYATPMKFVSTLMLVMAIKTLANSGTNNFDTDMIGQPPPGWLATQTGAGTNKWAVLADTSAPSPPKVLQQSGTAAYPICIRENSNLMNGFVEVKFKPVAGHEDQAGGVIWRVQDADNYYVCRANALEDNVVLYKTVKGKRTPLDIVGRKGGYGVDTKVNSGQWHTLRVEFAGARFKVFYNGKPLFAVEDRTFAEAGKVGVWTKDDSVTLFDDFRFGP